VRNFVQKLLGDKAAVAADAVAGIWDKLSNDAKVEIADAAVAKLKEWGVGEKKESK